MLMAEDSKALLKYLDLSTSAVPKHTVGFDGHASTDPDTLRF